MRNVLLGLLLLVVSQTFSQSNFLINKFEVENISSENVNSIFLDKNNFFWISTPEGLNRYDGSINSIFKSNPFDSTTLSNNLVFETFQIDNKGIYIKSTTRLDYFSYVSNSFVRTGVSSPIYHTRNEKNLFISSKNDGVYIFNLNDFTSLNLKFDPRNPLSISSSNFNTNQNQILLEVDDDLWIGTSYGLNKYNLSSNLNKRFYETKDSNTLNSNYINDLFFVDKKYSSGKIAIANKILAATQNGLTIINPENNEINNYESLKNTNIYNTFSVDDDIIIHSEEGLFVIDKIDESRISLRKISNTSGYGKTRKITDNEFILYTPLSNNFKRIIKNKNDYFDVNVSMSNELRINDVRNFKGAYYISTESGIFRVTEKLNSLTNKNEELDENENIIAIQENDYYRILLTDSRILIFEEDELYVSYPLEDIIGEESTSNATILLEEDEYLYIGTDKLHIMDLYTDEIREYKFSTDGLNSLMEGDINNFSLLIDEEFNKELWVSLNTGISIEEIRHELITELKSKGRHSLIKSIKDIRKRKV